MRGMGYAAIEDFHAAQSDADRRICDRLRFEISRGLPEATSGIWYAHPVWKLGGNPIVGYSKLKGCIRLLFWSGRSFETPGLKVEGKFKAAEARFTDPDQIDTEILARWLDEARRIQWDYKNIVKRKGRLDRLA